jgi:hypothetical protein
MPARPLPLIAAAAALAVATPHAVPAAPIGVVTQPLAIATEVGARLRWGATGFEASIFDPHAAAPDRLRHIASLDPRGAPAWQVGQPHGFRVAFSSTTGELSLAVDFDRSGGFDAGEAIARTAFSQPGLGSYAGMGFEALWISARQRRDASSRITDLKINGIAMPALLPAAGQGIGAYYALPGMRPIAEFDITGNITFATRGTAQESPAWDFKFLNAREPVHVPLPAAMALMGLALLVLAWVRRPRDRTGQPVFRGG